MKLNKNEINELKDQFLEICSIDNPSGDEGKMAKWVSSQAEGLKCDPITDEKRNVFFRIPGKGKALLLCAHLDSVQPCIHKKPRFDGKIFISDGTTILGADDGCGISTILTTIKYLKKHKIAHRPIEVLFTSMEEVGGLGIKDFNFSHITSEEGITVDSVAPVGDIVMKSPYKYRFSFVAHGKASHGGRISQGLSAIKMMADFLHQLPVGEVMEDVFLNVGKIKGGSAINTVPAEAQIQGAIKIKSEGEIRSGSSDKFDEIVTLINKITNKVQKNYPEGKIFFDYSLQRGGYMFETSDPLVKSVKKAIKAAGYKPGETESFGVSDANTLNSMGLKSILLGTGVKYAHTTKECIQLSDLVGITEILLHFCTSPLK